MFAQIYREELKKLRKQYPKGCTVELIEMSDPYREMPPGMTDRKSVV